MSKTKQIGRSGIHVIPLCLGTNVFGWNVGEQASFDVLDAFVAGGGNFIDTADIYSTWAPGNAGGESETIIGNWMRVRGNRSQIVLATKVGMEMGHGGKGLKAAYIARAVDDSLRRLGTDYIDLYQAHTDDAETPLEETMQAFDALQRAGKVRALGASNYSGARLQAAIDVSKAHGLARYECLQPKYNYIDREPYEADNRDVCIREQVGVIPYFGLARGFLSGKYKQGEALPETARAAGVQSSYFNDNGWAGLGRVQRAAAALNATASQVALAWLIDRAEITAPIASATTPDQVRELLGALTIDIAPVRAILDI
jgi:aryl-alcohol dehydrogenase-like predicted oxidoreductase